MMRFFLGARRRCACDVSTMDTSDLPDLFPRLIVASRTTSLSLVPLRASTSEVMTLVVSQVRSQHSTPRYDLAPYSTNVRQHTVPRGCDRCDNLGAARSRHTR